MRSKNWHVETQAERTAPDHIRRVCLMIAAVIFCYAIVRGDIPVMFLALAYLTGEGSSRQQLFKQSVPAFLQGMLRGFSVTLFVGAVGLLLV